MNNSEKIASGPTGPKGISDAQIVDALAKTAGVLSHAARQLGVDRAGLHRRISRSAELRAAADGIGEEILDAAESIVFEAITDRRDPAMAKWYLGLRGKDRGYNRRQFEDPLRQEDIELLVEAAAARGIDALRGLQALLQHG